jgi:monoamine oxidase
MLAGIDVSPEVSQKKREMMTLVAFSSAVRIFLQMRRAYWRDEGYNGFAVMDTLGEIWDLHFDNNDSPSLLVCYAKDELADRLCNMLEEEKIENEVNELEVISPGSRERVEQGTSFCWRMQPWIERDLPRRLRTWGLGYTDSNGDLIDILNSKENNHQ